MKLYLEFSIRYFHFDITELNSHIKFDLVKMLIQLNDIRFKFQPHKIY